MRFNFSRRTKCDVNPPSIRFPPRDARREPFVRVGDPAIVLFLEFVLRRIRRRITSQPELLDELLPLIIGSKPLECRSLLISDDVTDILAKPLTVWGLQFLAELFLPLAAFLVA